MVIHLEDWRKTEVWKKKILLIVEIRKSSARFTDGNSDPSESFLAVRMSLGY